jgi:hypothetical protein
MSYPVSKSEYHYEGEALAHYRVLETSLSVSDDIKFMPLARPARLPNTNIPVSSTTAFDLVQVI